MESITANALYSILRRLCALRCTSCQVSGVRMWRKAHLGETMCLACSLEDQREAHKAYKKIGIPGMWPKGENIGRRLPAICDEKGRLWGYSSIPEQAVSLWRSLPDRSPDQREAG